MTSKPTERALGCDISAWDGYVDFEKMRSAGVSFVFIKASQATWQDRNFERNWQAAQDAGLLRGAYHYLDWTKPADAQAQYFLNLLSGDCGELPPVLDYEDGRNTPNSAWMLALMFLAIVEQGLNIKPFIYTSPGYWKKYGTTIPVGYPLWIAHYGVQCPSVPLSWTTWTFWQYTDKGNGSAYGVSSRDVDLNWYNGTTDALYGQYGHPAGLPLPLPVRMRAVATVNIRSGPAVTHPKVGELSPGQAVNVETVHVETSQRVWVRHRAGWSAIVHDGQVLMREAL